MANKKTKPTKAVVKPIITSEIDVIHQNINYSQLLTSPILEMLSKEISNYNSTADKNILAEKDSFLSAYIRLSNIHTKMIEVAISLEKERARQGEALHKKLQEQAKLSPQNQDDEPLTDDEWKMVERLMVDRKKNKKKDDLPPS